MTAWDSWRWLRLVISAACCAISAAGAMAGVVVVLLSVVPVPPMPLVILVSLVGGSFALLFPALAWKAQSELTLGRLPVAAFIFAIICFITGFVQLAFTHGQGEIIHGAYYTQNHSTFTRVSHGTYLWSLRAEARMFGGAACLIYVLAAFNYAGVWFDNLRDPLGAIGRITRIGWRRTRVSQLKPPPGRRPTHTRRYHGNPARRPPRDL